jgi:hypothetical protein
MDKLSNVVQTPKKAEVIKKKIVYYNKLYNQKLQHLHIFQGKRI